jgi:hypothetical protein
MTRQRTTDNIPAALVRVVEWMEWLPAYRVTLGEHFDQQRGRTIQRNAALHQGYTGFRLRKGERIENITVQPTGQSKEFPIDNSDSDTEPEIYGLYLFQALLVEQTSETIVNSKLKAQNEPLAKADQAKQQGGRNRKDDLVIVKRQ